MENTRKQSIMINDTWLKEYCEMNYTVMSTVQYYGWLEDLPVARAVVKHLSKFGVEVKRVETKRATKKTITISNNLFAKSKTVRLK